MEKGSGNYQTEEVDFEIDRNSFDEKWSASQGRPLDGNEVVQPRIRAAKPLARLMVLITAFLTASSLAMSTRCLRARVTAV